MRHTSLIAAAALAATAFSPAIAQVRPSTLPAVVPTNPIARPQPITPLPVPPSDQNRSGNQNVNDSRNFAGTVRCESQNFQPRTCRANTQNRVEIVQVHGGSCARNRTFTYNANQIRVTEGCRATFAFGFGNVQPTADNGSNALPWMLAGAGATAGIVALANSGNNNQPAQQAQPAPVAPPATTPPAATPPVATPPAATVPQPPFPALPPAAISANIQMLTSDQQRTMQTCLFEGARQTGISGGTVFKLDSVDEIVAGNGGWRFRFRATGTWPNGQRQGSVFCRATPTSIIEFTVTPRA